MNRGDKWSRTENEIVVDAYIRLLEAEKSGYPLVKAEVRREVEARTGRSRSSGWRGIQNKGRSE